MNTIAEKFEARKSFIYQYPSFYEYSKLKFMLSLTKHENSYITFGPVAVKLIFEPWHEISNNVVCATSKDSDQPAHTRSLIRAIASRLNIL